MINGLRQRLEHFPRLQLAAYPTPLTHLPRLSRSLGRPIYVKRDDELGPGLGGNKTRKLAYLLGDAQAHGARKVATFGGLQSNHARLTAAAAARLGLEAHLFYFEKKPSQLRGNLLVNELLGARMHFFPLGAGGDGRMSLETTICLVRLLALLRLGGHYFMPVGGHNWLGALGYVEAALEIDEQARALGIEDARPVQKRPRPPAQSKRRSLDRAGGLLRNPFSDRALAPRAPARAGTIRILQLLDGSQKCSRKQPATHLQF